MTERFLLHATVNAQSAVARVESLLDGGSARIEQRIFYPYYRFSIGGSVRWLFHSQSLRFNCLVDARTGNALSADPMTMEKADALPEGCLAVRRSNTEAAARARRYAQHAMGRGLRLMSDFQTQVDSRGLVYRPFWVVESGSLRILLDAVTGELHPLSNHATTPQSCAPDERRSDILDGTHTRAIRELRRTDHEQTFTT